MSIPEAVSAAVGAVALVVTAYLVLLGIRFSRESLEFKKDLQDLKNIVEGQRDKLFGLRASAATIGTMLSDSYTALDITRRSLTNVCMDIWKDQPERYLALSTAITGPLERLSRIQEYLKLLNPRTPERFSESLEDFVEKFPDETAVDELTDLAALLPPKEAEAALQAARKLKQRVRGYDSSEWTGLD